MTEISGFSNNFSKFCADSCRGISHEFTVPYCPQQNGVAARLNRTIMKEARSTIYHAKLPLEFWAEVCSTTVYPTFECLFSRRPYLSPLKVFGCVSYVHVPDNQRRKLDAKNRKECFCWISSWCQEEKNDLEIKKKYVETRDVQLKTN